MTETQDNHQMTKSDHRQAAALVVVMTIILVSLSFFIFTWQKSREEVVTEKPTVDVPVKVSAVVGPQVRIKKQGGSYVLDPSTPITIGQNDSGINFLNETGETVGIFIPVLRNDNNKIINYPGTDQTTSFTLESLKADAAKCEADDEACRTYEFLGSVYPANFVGKIVFDPTYPDLATMISHNANTDGTYDITVTIRNIGTQNVNSGFYTYLYIDPTDNPPTTSTADTSYTRTPELVAGGNLRWSRRSHVFSPGQHKVYAWIDRNNNINEGATGEQNNLTEAYIINVP